MRNLPPSNLTPPQPARRLVFLTLLAIIVIAIGGTLLGNACYPGLAFRNEVLHTFLEATGAISALTLTLMILLSKNEHEDVSLALVTAAGLISMCVLDAMHSMVQPGPLFFWLRSCSTLIGGFFFALAWFTPNYWLVRSGNRWVLSVINLSLVFGLGSIKRFVLYCTMSVAGFVRPTVFLVAALAYWWYWPILRLAGYVFVLAHLFILGLTRTCPQAHNYASEIGIR